MPDTPSQPDATTNGTPSPADPEPNPRHFYDPKIHPAVIRALARNGCTQTEIAEAIGVSRRTISGWAQAFPRVASALRQGRVYADSKVEDALFKKAIGGDVTAMIFWLKNRKMNDWRDRREVEMSGELSVKEQTQAAMGRVLSNPATLGAALDLQDRLSATTGDS